MKKTFKCLLAIAAVVCTTVASATTGDAVLAFSTKGPDAYADGTPVREGEYYALVWTRGGTPFAGVDLEGRAVDAENSAIVTAQPLADARRRCPLTLFQLDAAFVASHADGAYALVLLDTRVSDGKGGLVPSADLSHVNGWSEVEGSRIYAVSGRTGTAARAGGELGTRTLQASAIPSGLEIPEPRITGIRVVDGQVELTVKGTSDRLLYNVATGASPERRDRTHAAEAVQGQADAEAEVRLVAPAVEGQRFFKVIRN